MLLLSGLSSERFCSWSKSTCIVGHADRDTIQYLKRGPTLMFAFVRLRRDFHFLAVAEPRYTRPVRGDTAICFLNYYLSCLFSVQADSAWIVSSCNRQLTHVITL